MVIATWMSTSAPTNAQTWNPMDLERLIRIKMTDKVIKQTNVFAIFFKLNFLDFSMRDPPGWPLGLSGHFRGWGLEPSGAACWVGQQAWLEKWIGVDIINSSSWLCQGFLPSASLLLWLFVWVTPMKPEGLLEPISYFLKGLKLCSSGKWVAKDVILNRNLWAKFLISKILLKPSQAIFPLLKIITLSLHKVNTVCKN